MLFNLLDPMRFSKQTLTPPTVKVIQTILLRLMSLILILSLAWLWVMLGATPALAQANTINYSNTNLENRDFSNADLGCR